MSSTTWLCSRQHRYLSPVSLRHVGGDIRHALSQIGFCCSADLAKLMQYPRKARSLLDLRELQNYCHGDAQRKSFVAILKDYS